jgi:hypothetical protein
VPHHRAEVMLAVRVVIRRERIEHANGTNQSQHIGLGAPIDYLAAGGARLPMPVQVQPSGQTNDVLTATVSKVTVSRKLAS